MSVKLSKRLSSKKKKQQKENPQLELLLKLGLETFLKTPINPSSLLEIHFWNPDYEASLNPKDLPKAFLQRLWLLRPDARSVRNDQERSNEPDQTEINIVGENMCDINPLDLVTAVLKSSDTFLQQEIIVRMVQCQFAVPLVLPPFNPEDPGTFLLWPMRGVIGQWKSPFLGQNHEIREGLLATTPIPMVSFVKLGTCSVSKSKVLNRILSGKGRHSEMFLHRGMDGGEHPRRLSNGLVEVGCHVPDGEDVLPVPLVIANLRGDASLHEKSFTLLCQASSAVVFFCENLREKDKQLLVSLKEKTSEFIFIDLSDSEENENKVVGFPGQNLHDCLRLPEGSILRGREMTEGNLAEMLGQALADLLRAGLKPVTLEAVGKFAEGLGLHVDEGAVCKKAMAMVEEIVTSLDEMGFHQFMRRQLPLQGYLWKKLASIQKAESKLNHHKPDEKLQKEKDDLLAELGRYKTTEAMKIFTDALFTTDTLERTYFLKLMNLRLSTVNCSADQTNVLVEEVSERIEFEQQNETEDDADSFYSDTFEEEEDEMQDLDKNDEMRVSDRVLTRVHSSTRTREPEETNHDDAFSRIIEDKHIWKEEKDESTNRPVKPMNTLADERVIYASRENGHDENKVDEPKSNRESSDKQLVQHHQTSLGLEHFLREMGLIFEMTHISPGSGSHNVLRLPSVAADLLLYGVPLEIMDGDASTIPINWLSAIFAEVNRSLSLKHLSTRILTCLGLHHAKNSKVLSALFGFSFPDGFQKSTRGVYVVALHVPQNLREQMECDFLLVVDVEGLCCSPSGDSSKARPQDIEMATVAAGMSDVLLLNISSLEDSDLETNIGVAVSALLCIQEFSSMPSCHLLSQDGDINSTLIARQLMRVCSVLQTSEKEIHNSDDDLDQTSCPVSFDMVPLCNPTQSQPLNREYSQGLVNLRKSLNDALKMSACQVKTSGWPEFMRRLYALWDAVKSESFSIGLQKMDVAMAFSILCTELSTFEEYAQGRIESWMVGAEKRICATEANALDSSSQSSFLPNLTDEGREVVQREIAELRKKIETYLSNDQHLKTHFEAHNTILMRNADKLQDRLTKETEQRLESSFENHCYSTQLNKFESSVHKEQESKLLTLVEYSKSTKHLYGDEELEKEFEDMWSFTTSKFDFRSSESTDITLEVKEILTDNLTSRGVNKHIEKVSQVGQNQSEVFQIQDEYFGYRSRITHMFEENNRPQRQEATLLANNIIEEYKQFAADKSKSTTDFSGGFITEMLENIERALREKPMQIRSVFEVDLKVFLCSVACRDFQILHDQYCKDGEMLSYINSRKSAYMADFIYNFRKQDECQRVAQMFMCDVMEPMVLDYIHRPLGLEITKEIQDESQKFSSVVDCNQNLLDEMVREPKFESFMEYLVSYQSFLLKHIQASVKSHLSKSNTVNKWRQKRLGEIIGKVAAAVSETAEGTNGVLSDTRPLLERLCLTLEKDGDVNISRNTLNSPVFSITAEWDRFVAYLMELLAAMRLDLAKQFTENMEVEDLLHSLPIDPCDRLFQRLRFCEKQCPVCGAPCTVERKGHDVHMSSLHRPNGLLPNGVKEGPPQNDWHFSNGRQSGHTDCVYWRYVLAQFNESFAKEYGRQPEEIPEDWKRITRDEALDSLKALGKVNEQ